MGPQELRKEMDKFVVELSRTGLAIQSNTTVVEQLRGRRVLITWSNSQALDTDMREYASWLEYVALVRGRQYTALLSDFSLLQMSYWLERGRIVKHRLGYFPCPLLVDPDEVEEWGLLDWLELLRGEDLRERLRQDAPLRFDFDPAASGEGHSASHLHVSRQCCRIPVYAPLSPGRFIHFIFSHFYPNDWSRSGFLRSWPCRQAPRTISPAERRELHLSVEND